MNPATGKLGKPSASDRTRQKPHVFEDRVSPGGGGKKSVWWLQDLSGVNSTLPGAGESTEKGPPLDGSRRQTQGCVGLGGFYHLAAKGRRRKTGRDPPVHQVRLESFVAPPYPELYAVGKK